jgi:hypothetical protein
MLRQIIAVLILSVVAHPAGANALAREAQELLFRLGYEISVDGAWGPQSQRVITQFYQDRNENFDGSLDRIEVDDLLSEIEQRVVQPLLPLGNVPSPICNSNLLFEATRPVLSTAELGRYEAIPSRSIDRNHFVDLVGGRLYQWTAGLLAMPDNTELAAKLSEQISNLASARVATVIGQSDVASDGSNETAHLWQTDYLLTLGYAVLALKETGLIEDSTLEAHVSYLAGLVYSSPFQDTRFFNASRCTTAGLGDMSSRLGDCQNHTYGKLHLRAIMGFLTDNDNEVRAAIDLYRYAINDLSDDGALWREASRGAHSWAYYGHGLGHLVGVADLVSRRWFDLWAYHNSDGLSLHDAVAFYSESLADPTNEQLMYKYAQRNLGIDRDRRYGDDPLNLDRYQEVLNKRYYSEWLPVYLDVFPSSPSGLTILGLLRNVMPPEITFHYGLNTWCVYQLPE